MKHDFTLCQDDLYGFSFEIFTKPGSTNTMDAQLLDTITGDLTARLNATLEDMFWNGEITGSPASIEFDGVLHQMASDTDVIHSVHINWNAANTAATVISAVNALYNSLPAVAQKDTVLFVGYDVYNKITQAYLSGFNYNVGFDAANGTIPGTSMKLKRVNGLTGINTAVATVANNFVYVTDTLAEPNAAEIKYNPYTYQIEGHIPFAVVSGYIHGIYISKTATS